MSYKAIQPIGSEGVGYWDIVDENYHCVATVWPVYIDHAISKKGAEATAQIARELAAVKELRAALEELEDRHLIVVPPANTACTICDATVTGGERLEHEKSCPFAAIAKANGEVADDIL